MNTNQLNIYWFTCSCGDVITVEAENRKTAMNRMKKAMTKNAIERHMGEKHEGEPVLSVEETHMLIEENLAMA